LIAIVDSISGSVSDDAKGSTSANARLTIIDLSEVPADLLAVAASTVARLRSEFETQANYFAAA
jgi:hypothetical protein